MCKEELLVLPRFNLITLVYYILFIFRYVFITAYMENLSITVLPNLKRPVKNVCPFLGG
jgi:hypothetical protein